MGENRWSLPVIILITLLIVMWVSGSVAALLLGGIRAYPKIRHAQRLGDSLQIDVWSSWSGDVTVNLVESDRIPVALPARKGSLTEDERAELDQMTIARTHIGVYPADGLSVVERTYVNLTGIPFDRSRYWVVADSPEYVSSTEVTGVLKSGLVYTAGIGQHWPFSYILGAVLLATIVLTMAIRAKLKHNKAARSITADKDSSPS